MKACHYRIIRTAIMLVAAASLGLAQAKDTPKVSKGEAEAYNAVVTASGMPAKLKAAEEFLKKNSRSTIRIKLATYVSEEIGAVSDGKQRLGYIESYNKLFNSPEEQDIILPIKVDGLALAGRTDEAFQLAPQAIAKSPDNLFLLTQLALKGSNEVRQGKPNFGEPSRQYGESAIRLLEENKRPPQLDEANFASFKNQWLPELYQALGFIAFQRQDFPAARSNFEKNVALSPKNAFSHLMLAEIANGDYQKVATAFNEASGPQKDKLLKQAEALMDVTIELYAHTVALSEGNPQMQQIHVQIVEQLQQYYKFRHAGKLDGLQQLIDKYKK